MGGFSFFKATVQKHRFGAENLLLHNFIDSPIFFHVDCGRLGLLKQGAFSVLCNLIIEGLPDVKLDTTVLLLVL